MGLFKHIIRTSCREYLNLAQTLKNSNRLIPDQKLKQDNPMFLKLTKSYTKKGELYEGDFNRNRR